MSRRFSKAQRQAIAAGCQNCERSIRTHATNASVIRVLKRLGFDHSLAPKSRAAEIIRTVPAIAAGLDPSTAEGAAMAHAAAHLEAFCRWIQRNPTRVRDILREPTPNKATPATSAQGAGVFNKRTVSNADSTAKRAANRAAG